MFQSFPSLTFVPCLAAPRIGQPGRAWRRYEIHPNPPRGRAPSAPGCARSPPVARVGQFPRPGTTRAPWRGCAVLAGKSRTCKTNCQIERDCSRRHQEAPGPPSTYAQARPSFFFHPYHTRTRIRGRPGASRGYVGEREEEDIFLCIYGVFSWNFFHPSFTFLHHLSPPTGRLRGHLLSPQALFLLLRRAARTSVRSGPTS